MSKSRASVENIRSAFRKLAKELNVKADIRNLTVNGVVHEVVFHADHLYIYLPTVDSRMCLSGYCRSVKSKKDYSGANNNIVSFDEVVNTKSFALACKPLLDAKGEGTSFLARPMFVVI